MKKKDKKQSGGPTVTVSRPADWQRTDFRDAKSPPVTYSAFLGGRADRVEVSLAEFGVKDWSDLHLVMNYNCPMKGGQLGIESPISIDQLLRLEAAFTAVVRTARERGLLPAAL